MRRKPAHLLAVRNEHGLEGGEGVPCAPPLPERVLLPSSVSRRFIFFWPTAGNFVLRRPSWSSKDINAPPARTRVGCGGHLLVVRGRGLAPAQVRAGRGGPFF